MSASEDRLDAASGQASRGESLTVLLSEHRFGPDDVLISSDGSLISLADVRAEISRLADALAKAAVLKGSAIGALVGPGPTSIVVMFAIWKVGAVYVPMNRRLTAAEISQICAETPIALIVGAAEDLDATATGLGEIEYSLDWTAASMPVVRRPARITAPRYGDDVALVLRTSGTTGRPKAVLLRHSGTLNAIDASLRKLRGGRGGASAMSAQGADTHGRGSPTVSRRQRMNLIPVSLTLWSGIFTTLFSFRAGFGVVLLSKFTPIGFVETIRKFGITSTVLAPTMITMLYDAPDVDDLRPLAFVRSITAPLSPELARRFRDRFGVLVLNSYGQTELGGEVVGWTVRDLREFGEQKLGAVGRPYEDVDVRIRTDDGTYVGPGEVGEILVRSPFRMRGYAADGGTRSDMTSDRLIDGYLRTGDIGYLDEDNFLWVQGRVSDMINRGGLKVFPDEVEDVLLRYPAVKDAAVAGVPDKRLGEVPHAWIVPRSPVTAEELIIWCREFIAPYKVPTGFTFVGSLPRNDVGKVLRRELIAAFASRHSVNTQIERQV